MAPVNFSMHSSEIFDCLQKVIHEKTNFMIYWRTLSEKYLIFFAFIRACAKAITSISLI